MQFKIEEQLRVSTPNVSEFLVREAKSRPSTNKRLIAQIAAIHEGVTKNYNKYTAEELKKAVPSWMMPYPKPILLNHDINTEPLGRIVNADFATNAESVGYIRLRSAIMDPLAASKVIDGRYLTGSVGGMPKAALCSICHQDVIAAAREGDRCGHQRGSVYEGKTCTYEHRDISFHEYSFVNAPGDDGSQVETFVSESATAELSIFSLNMEAGSIQQFRESDGLVDVREWLTESEAQQVYMDIAFGTKYAESAEIPKTITFGAIDSTIAQEPENSTLKEQDMSEAKTPNEDVLKVAELLTDILHGDKNEVVVEENEEETPTEDVSESEEAPEEVAAEEGEAAEEETSVEEDETPEEETPAVEEEEKVDEEEAEAETSEESAEESEVTEPEAEESAAEADAEVTSEEEAEEAPAEGEPSVAELQAKISDLEAQNMELKEQNDRMKKALHTELVEKVVDAKIAVGHAEASERETLIEEYSKRSAQSLADTFVDVRAFAEKNGYEVSVVDGTVPSLEIKAVATTEKNSEIVGEESDSEKEDVVVVSEDDLLVNEMTQLLIHGTEKYLQSKNK